MLWVRVHSGVPTIQRVPAQQPVATGPCHPGKSHPPSSAVHRCLPVLSLAYLAPFWTRPDVRCTGVLGPAYQHHPDSLEQGFSTFSCTLESPRQLPRGPGHT